MPDARRATPITPPKMGLLAAASVSESTTIGGARWGWAGVEWRPEMLDDAADAFGARALKCVTSSLTSTGLPTNEQAFPFMVFAADPCPSTIDDADVADKRDRQARARRLLAATRSAAVAKEFWSGAISTVEATGNTWLKKAGSTVVGASAKPARALAELDQAIATNLANNRGMIHCRVLVLDLLVQAMAVRREGNLWLTPFDNIVVADAGYDGTGPAGGEWMFATTPVEVAFGPVFVNEAEEGLTRNTNSLFIVAQQDVIVLHEPHLLWHRALVDLT